MDRGLLKVNRRGKLRATNHFLCPSERVFLLQGKQAGGLSVVSSAWYSEAHYLVYTQ